MTSQQDWPGLAHLLEHLLFGDNRHHRGDARLMPWVEAVGGAVNASTEAASTHFFFEVPAPLLADGVQRLISMLTWPLWSDQAAMREVAVIDAEYRARRHDGDTLVEAALAWAVADGHPLHRFCAGNLSHWAAIRRNCCTPCATTISVFFTLPI
ncbi:insulinase family protein [Candidatus Sodalis endolongispinus]|uniref:Insulinase family protein n=1 Tax=Candidatus Sodalis endolongispinus TaxID=2812662 RepID=A0ABS5YEA4_9GAMM|nr:insulinase family protein [Candidatus Sodalis endolongispinus]MBT9433263.1 insulinase family protein [Candidatus Sodalis endolongispinus]